MMKKFLLLFCAALTVAAEAQAVADLHALKRKNAVEEAERANSPAYLPLSGVKRNREKPFMQPVKKKPDVQANITGEDALRAKMIHDIFVQ